MQSPKTFIVLVVGGKSGALGRMVAVEDSLLQHAVKIEPRLVHDVGGNLARLGFGNQARGHFFRTDAHGVNFDERIFFFKGGGEPLRRLSFHRSVKDDLGFFPRTVKRRLCRPRFEIEKNQSED